MITRPWLLKMYISSQLASDDFGLTDEQIFNLIGNHNMEPRIPKEDDHDQLDSTHIPIIHTHAFRKSCMCSNSTI